MRALFLYTELAPYFLACVERLVKDFDLEVHIVRWPLNKEAPFQLKYADRVHVHERERFDDAALLSFATDLAPDIVFASGWVDKGYLKVCRALRSAGRPTVMCSDTAWRGDARQFAATVAARLWLKRTFSHAWVTGEAQARYARKLGFKTRCHTQRLLLRRCGPLCPSIRTFQDSQGRTLSASLSLHGALYPYQGTSTPVRCVR
ncbi:MAG: hypothetical protein IPG74_12625 [Flavobacteriales bacterium]|nr:hypothetical protein [Flavobacteriales bacterium]